MDCTVCELRSAVGFCGECKALLCEVCGKTCSHCDKMVCTNDLFTTPHGRELCQSCMKRYKKRKARRRAEKEAT